VLAEKSVDYFRGGLIAVLGRNRVCFYGKDSVGETLICPLTQGLSMVNLWRPFRRTRGCSTCRDTCAAEQGYCLYGVTLVLVLPHKYFEVHLLVKFNFPIFIKLHVGNLHIVLPG
jgi:hypothetical protein